VLELSGLPLLMAISVWDMWTFLRSLGTLRLSHCQCSQTKRSPRLCVATVPATVSASPCRGGQAPATTAHDMGGKSTTAHIDAHGGASPSVGSSLLPTTDRRVDRRNCGARADDRDFGSVRLQCPVRQHDREYMSAW